MIRRNLFSFVAAAFFAAATFAHADYAAPFTAPPFKLNEPIIGIEGWEPRLPGPASSSARLIAVRWDGGAPAVLLDGASLKNDFPKTTGQKIQVRIQIAITFPDAAPKLQQIRFGFPGSLFREIVFEGSPGAGLGFGNGTGRGTQVLVPFEQLKPNTYYTIVVTIDNASSTCEARITGLGRDGAALDVTAKDLAFDTKAASALSSVFIISSPAVRAYLKEFSVTSL